MGRPKVALLDQDRIASAAAGVVMADGIEAVTLRRVARELHVAPTSLYNHIADRNELLDLLVARVLGAVDVSVLDHPDWIEAVVGFARAFRDALVRFAPLVSTVATRPARTDASLRLYERLLGRLAAAGFDAQHAATLAYVLDDYVIGTSINLARDVLIEGRESSYPLTARTVPMVEPNDAFDRGVRLLVLGFERGGADRK